MQTGKNKKYHGFVLPALPYRKGKGTVGYSSFPFFCGTTTDRIGEPKKCLAGRNPKENAHKSFLIPCLICVVICIEKQN